MWMFLGKWREQLQELAQDQVTAVNVNIDETGKYGYARKTINNPRSHCDRTRTHGYVEGTLSRGSDDDNKEGGQGVY